MKTRPGGFPALDIIFGVARLVGLNMNFHRTNWRSRSGDSQERSKPSFDSERIETHPRIEPGNNQVWDFLAALSAFKTGGGNEGRA
jgi:hypothetical protein